MNGIYGATRKINCLFNMCETPGLCSALAQFLTIVEIWSLNTISIYLLKYARREVDDRFDSFFVHLLPDYYRQQTNFLEWCMQCNIPLQRLRIHMPLSDAKDSHGSYLRKLNGLKKATSSYLETYGKNVLAIQLNFSTVWGPYRLITNFVATHFILMVLHKCKNLIMLCLDGECLKFSDKQFRDILLASCRCLFLRDWVFVGNTLLSSEDRCGRFLRYLRFNLRHGVRQLVINRGNRLRRKVLCPDQFTLKNLRCHEENQTVRVSNYRSRTSYGNMFWCEIGK